MGFMDNYEDVNSRIKRFRAEFPSGRLIAFIEDIDLEKFKTKESKESH